MPVFSYVALAENGAVLKGRGVAASGDEMAGMLAGQGLMVQSLQRRRTGFGTPWRRRIQPEAFLLFTHEMIALLRAGLTIPDALTAVADERDSPQFTAVLTRVLAGVRAGRQLSESCAEHPEVFDALFISTLKTGEKTGNLAEVLTRYQDYLKRRVALGKKVSQAMTYPVFLLLTLAIILAVLFIFVLPRFVRIYADFNAELPLPTLYLMGIVTHLPLVLLGMGVFTAGGWALWKAAAGSVSGSLLIGKAKENFPLLGGLHRISMVARAARTLSVLHSAGTPLVEALRTAQGALGNPAYALRFSLAVNLVEEGKGLAESFRSMDVMPSTALKLIQVGEASGSLAGMLEEVARYYEEMLESRMARVVTILEPLLMLMMGIIVGGIILVMYLPIFNLADIIR